MTHSVDIWELIIKAGPANAGVRVANPGQGKEPTLDRHNRFRWILLDALSAIWWSYVFLNIFIFNVDQFLGSFLAPELKWILTYKFVVFISLAIALAAFSWNLSTLGSILYVAFYPLLLLVWKLPKWAFEKRLHANWLFVLSVANALTSLFGSFRYHVLTKGAFLLAAVAIFTAQSDWLLASAGVVTLLTLVIATVRVISRTFKTNTFVGAQKRGLEKLNNFLQQPIELAIQVNTDGSADIRQVQNLATTIQTAALTNRALHFWAHKLQQYRDSNLAFLVNTLSYVTYCVGAICALFLLNLVAIELFPKDFAHEGIPSSIAILLYSLSSLAFADGGGISAQGDSAYLLKILAGLVGPTFVLTVLLNAMLFRGSRDDIELETMVQEFRARARMHEDNFRKQLNVGFDEAIKRLMKLGYLGLTNVAFWLQDSLPADFLADPDKRDST